MVLSLVVSNRILLACCLMTNYYYLLIKTLDGNLSRGLRLVNGGIISAIQSWAAEIAIFNKTDTRPFRLKRRAISLGSVKRMEETISCDIARPDPNFLRQPFK